jgi:hypothetical protein
MIHLQIFENFSSLEERFANSREKIDEYYEFPEDSEETPRTFRTWQIPGGRQGAEIYFNQLPKGLRNELTRPVKDMLINSNPRDWSDLELVLPKIEKLMGVAGTDWKTFPGTSLISGLRTVDEFIEWLRKGYIRELEKYAFSR